MSSSFLPSYFGSPVITNINNSRFDSKGRQLSFTETDVQRLERMAFVNASRSRSSSPMSMNSASSSPATTPRKLISEPFADPIELMANRLAEEYMLSSDDFSSSSDEEQQFVYSHRRSSSVSCVPSVAFSPPTVKVASTFKPGYRRKGSTLTVIAEED